MTDDVYVNNDMGWRNTDTKLVTYGIGGAYEKVDDNTDRDYIRDTDIFEQNLKPEDYDKLADLGGVYWGMFVGGQTGQHRQLVRTKAHDFEHHAQGIDEEFADEANRLDENSRRELRKQLARLKNQMNSVGGTTRSCFMAKVSAEAMIDAEARLNAEKLGAFQAMQQTQVQAIAAANDAVYKAYVQADSEDYNKLLQTFTVMKGAWTTNNSDDVYQERVERDVSTKRVTADFERTVGSTSETSGVYESDYNAVLAAGASTGGLFDFLIGGINGP